MGAPLRIIRLLSAAALLAVAANAAAASAYTASTLHTFCVQRDCSDGAASSDLTMDSAGNLYGAAFEFPAANGGVVFELVANADRTDWTYKTLYSFCTMGPLCTDGPIPTGKLVVDVNGDLYGVTEYGGHGPSGTRWGSGSVYKLSHAGTNWSLKTLYMFGTRSLKSDGRYPMSGLVYAGAQSGVPYDGVSPLYGTAGAGGAHGAGQVFELAPANGKYTKTTLYDFCPTAGCPGGAIPQGLPVVDGTGNIFGATFAGGHQNSGVVFELPPGPQGMWTQSVVHDFCSQPGCADGGLLHGGVMLDAQGNIYGTNQIGGSAQKGVVYRIANDANRTLTVLKNFCETERCRDGVFPYGTLALGSDGTLFGTTNMGGDHEKGVVYALNAEYRVVQSFCAEQHCADGAIPATGVILDGTGTLYGTTVRGGNKHDAGTVFALKP